MMIGITAGQEPLYRPNYGVIMEPVMALNPIREYWSHMVKIDLPEIPNIPTDNANLRQCRERNVPGMNCKVLEVIVENLMHLRNTTANMIADTAVTIKDLIPETQLASSMSKTKRSLLPFLGDLASSLIGVATEADMDNLAEHIEVLENKTQRIGHLFSRQAQRMVTFMDNTDARISQAMNGIKKNQEYIHIVADTVITEVNHTVELLSRALKTLSGYVKHANLIQFQLEQLLTAVNEAIHGKLSSALLPPSTFRKILYHISEGLSIHFPEMQLASANIEHTYHTTSVLLTRRSNTLYLVLKVPLQSRKMGLATVYETITMPLPVPNNPTTATQVTGIPPYVAITTNGNYYASLEAKDLLPCSGTKLRFCSNPLPFQSTSQKSCILALINSDSLQIKQLCNFTLILQEPKPYIIRLSTGQIVVSDKSDITMQCRTGSRILPGCSHCIYDVPCSCSVQTKSLYFPPSVVHCQKTSQTSLPFHTVNLAVLQQFFDESILSNMSAQATYTKPINIQIPQIRVYEHEISHILASDSNNRLDLKQVIQATKNDEWAYKSLAEPILTGRLLPKRTGASKYSTIISFIGLTISILLITSTVYLLFKFNRLAATVATLSQLTKPAASTAIPPLIYTLPGPSPTSAFTTIWVIFFQDYLYLCLISLLLVALIVLYLKYKHCHNTKSTVIALELTNGSDCMMISLQSLPFCPEHWQFATNGRISQIAILGYCKPKIAVDWNGLTIQNTFTGQTLTPVTEAAINHWTAFKVRKILNGQYNFYVFLLHHGYAFHLGNFDVTNPIPPVENVAHDDEIVESN